MAQIAINIPDAVINRVLDAFSVAYNRPLTVQDPAFPNDPTKTIPNPETKAAFARRKVGEYVKEVVKGHEATLAASVAQKTAADKAEAEVTIT